MGYFINGKTNAKFMIKKENFKPAFQALRQLNANDSLKGGGGGNDKAPASKLNATYATRPNKWFGWMPWNYDKTCKDMVEVLREFGFEDQYQWHFDKNGGEHRGALLCRGLRFNKRGDLIGMNYNSKNGDINYVMDTLAPYVEKGGKMYWHGEDGAKYTADFDNIRPLSPNMLSMIRDEDVQLVARAKKQIKKTKAPRARLSVKGNPTAKLLQKIIGKLGVFAIACGGQLSEQTKKLGVDTASLPFNIMCQLWTDGFGIGTEPTPLANDSMLAQMYPDRDLANEDGNSAEHISSFIITDGSLLTSLKAIFSNHHLHEYGKDAHMDVDFHKLIKGSKKNEALLKIYYVLLGQALKALKLMDFNQHMPTAQHVSPTNQKPSGQRNPFIKDGAVHQNGNKITEEVQLKLF